MRAWLAGLVAVAVAVAPAAACAVESAICGEAKTFLTAFERV